MKKKVMTLVLMCCLAMSSEAQIYGGETWATLPTMDLYDTNVMNMHLRALAETAALRKENYFRYSDMAIEAYNNRQWNNVVYYVNEALNTRYYCGQLYYLRGYAYEQLGNLRAAKKDYKTGIKQNSSEAAQALASLKARKKRR
jgi:tetratricopeptide (TPR) repeat protein